MCMPQEVLVGQTERMLPLSGPTEIVHQKFLVTYYMYTDDVLYFVYFMFKV